MSDINISRERLLAVGEAADPAKTLQGVRRILTSVLITDPGDDDMPTVDLARQAADLIRRYQYLMNLLHSLTEMIKENE